MKEVKKTILDTFDTDRLVDVLSLAYKEGEDVIIPNDLIVKVLAKLQQD